MNFYNSANSASDNFEQQIKNFIKSNAFCQSLFKFYNVPIDYLDYLKITVKDLGSTLSEASDREIIINSSIANDKEFLANYAFIVVHELTHWLSKLAKERFYFNDKNERDSFVHAIAFEIANKKSLEEISQKVLPIISNQFSDKMLAKRFFLKLVAEAEKFKTSIAN